MNLDKLLKPKTIALIGASNREGTLGNDLIKMIGKGDYSGEIYPINPKYPEIGGYTCYPDIPSIGKPVDMAVLCVNAKRVEEQAKLCIEAGVGALTVFANCILEEEMQESDKLEDRLIKICEEADIPLLGHNAMGYYNNDIDLRVCGFEAPDEGVKGNIAFLSQSGSVFSTIGHNEPQLKFNLMVATGTGQVTSLEDYILYVLEMPTTKVVGVYMESVRKPALFVQALEKAREKKVPVVLMKVGKSALGAQFAQSHTGGLAGDDDAFQAVFDHYGVIRCETLCEMANSLNLFSHYPEIPRGALAAIADSGGERNLLADVAEEVGLRFAKLSDATMAKLAPIQEYTQEADNPLDPWGTGIGFEEIFEESLVVMLEDEDTAIGLISQDLRDGYYLSQGCVDSLLKACARQKKPAVFMTNFSGTRRAALTAQVSEAGSCVLCETRDSLAAIRNWLAFRDYAIQDAPPVPLALTAEMEKLLASGEPLQEKASLALLGSLGMSILPSFTVNSEEELEAQKQSYRFPAVLKTAVPGILHKADVGGVVLNLPNYEALAECYREMAARLGPQAVVAPMLPHNTELIFGMKMDPTFGPLVIVGAGGIYTEMLRDRVILLPTAGEAEIAEKLKSLKTYKLLCGFRGAAPADMEKLVGQVRQFCAVAQSLAGRVKEIDINPVAVEGCEIVALDALVIPS